MNKTKNIFHKIKETGKKLTSNKFLVLSFFLFMLLCCFFPYSGDDFAWGTQIGLERLSNWFYNYNGRYAGNLLILALTRSKALRVIVESVTFALIVKYMGILVNKENKNNYYLSILLLLLMPVTILRQAVTWASGFSNYVIPILLILYIINDNINLLKDKTEARKSGIIKAIWCLIISFVGSLFIENITLYNLFLIIVILIYEKIKTKKFTISNITYFVGSLAGTIYMFMNKAYLSVMNNTDGYRTIAHDNIIIRSIKTFIKDLTGYIFTNNVVVGIVLCICLIVLIIKFRKSIKKINKKVNALLNISMFAVILYLFNIVYLNLPLNDSIFTDNKMQLCFNCGVSVLMVLALIVITIVCINDNFKKRKILFYVASLIVFNAPLLIISPLGPRLFLTTYVFYILIINEMLDYTFKDKMINVENIIKILVLLGFFYLGSIYYSIHKVDVEQTKYIAKINNTESVITLPLIPHSRYVHCVNMTDNVFGYRYKLYHGIDSQVLVSYMKYDKWVKEVKEK